MALWIAFKMYLCHIVSNCPSRDQFCAALWIAFKMYLCHIVSNINRRIVFRILVVNCFQNVSLSYRFQFWHYKYILTFCCELLSKCIFVISFPIRYCFCQTVNRCELLSKCIFVISFPIVRVCFGKMFRCELLSKCIFVISFPMRHFIHKRDGMLWIAFKMYLCHIVSNRSKRFI